MKRYIRSTSNVDTFMKFHDDPDNYRNNPTVFDMIYEILDKYGDESEDVDVVFKRATPEDQRKLMDLIPSRGNKHMKKYIKSSKYVFETPYLGYCFYTASNPTWGYDAQRILHYLGGKRGYVKFPKGDDSYFRPSFIYMFRDESMYNDFIQDLKSHDLLGLIKLYDYKELPGNAIIIQED